MNGENEKRKIEIEGQILTAQKLFDENRVDSADRIMKWPGSAFREQFPEVWGEWSKLRNAIDQRKVDAYLYESIPPEFRLIDHSLYPSQTALETALALQSGPYNQASGLPAPGYKGGVLLYGPTGAGKTRAGFSILTARCREDPGLRFKYASAPDLKRRLADAARGGRSHAIIEELLDDSTATLFIDDLSQARFTASFAENLFELIDRIHREHVDLIVTVQTTGNELVRKWCSDDKDLTDTAQAIARRLRDYCHAVRFTKR